jgi:hypothetical protein
VTWLIMMKCSCSSSLVHPSAIEAIEAVGGAGLAFWWEFLFTDVCGWWMRCIWWVYEVTLFGFNILSHMERVLVEVWAGGFLQWDGLG